MDFFNPAYAAPLVSLALLWTVAVVTPGPTSSTRRNWPPVVRVAMA